MLSTLSTRQSAGFPRSAQFGERSKGLRCNAYFHVNSGVRPLPPPTFPLHPEMNMTMADLKEKNVTELSRFARSLETPEARGFRLRVTQPF
jgi:hypothetical protein